jgi:hypothetical protein
MPITRQKNTKTFQLFHCQQTQSLLITLYLYELRGCHQQCVLVPYPLEESARISPTISFHLVNFRSGSKFIFLSNIIPSLQASRSNRSVSDTTVPRTISSWTSSSRNKNSGAMAISMTDYIRLAIAQPRNSPPIQALSFGTEVVSRRSRPILHQANSVEAGNSGADVVRPTAESTTQVELMAVYLKKVTLNGVPPLGW